MAAVREKATRNMAVEEDVEEREKTLSEHTVLDHVIESRLDRRRRSSGSRERRLADAQLPQEARSPSLSVLARYTTPSFYPPRSPVRCLLLIYLG